MSDTPLDVELVRVGVVGGGQLARMMGEAAHGVATTLTVLASAPDDSAILTCDGWLIGEATDLLALRELAHQVDVVTFDHELVDLDEVAVLEKIGVTVHPSATSLQFAVDKAVQRTAFQRAGLPVPRFVVVNASSDERLTDFFNEIGGPPVVKATRGGYDGRGVLFPADRAEAIAMIDDLARANDVLVEERLALRGEVAQLIARAVDGSVVLYPLVSTVQADGMCVEVRFPAEVSADLHRRAGELAEQIASLIDVVGILAIEFFVTDEGLVVNEVALRPHNSGHWTIEGTTTSQFANHLLAVSGRALGAVRTTASAAVMVNVVGAEEPGSIAAARAIEGAHVHDYGKSWRPGRKLGHVTVVGDDAAAAHVTAWTSARAYGTRAREA